MKTDAEVTAEVRALARLDLNGLRQAWRDRYGQPPSLRSTDLLQRSLAWRIQAEAFGGLDRRTIEALSSKRSDPTLPPGTRLAREWKGVRHEVEVTPDGVRYADRDYASLSEVARAITGSRWNGPRFFGLRPRS